MLGSPLRYPYSSVQVARSKTGLNDQIYRIEFDFRKDDYNRDLIQKLRDKLREPNRYSHNRPVLPRQNAAAREWIDVVLSTDCNTVTFRIERDNLYLQGYQMPCGQWLEFGRDGPHLIPGSGFLGFTGSYIDLERVGQRTIEGTQVSRQQVIGAVDQLAETNDRVSRARCLALMVMVLCEATRFDEMSRRFANVMQSGSYTTETIEDWMVTLFRSWGDLSGRLLGADRRVPDPSTEAPYFPLPVNSPLRQRIQSALDAASYVGLLLGPAVSNTQSSLRHAVMGNSDADIPRGQPMMEVFSIQILDFSDTLSGDITVTDGLGQQTLFYGQQSVQPGDTLILSLLDRAISFWETITIKYNLTGQTIKFDQTDAWDIFGNESTYETKSTRTRRRSLVKCSANSSGSMSLIYDIFSEAWQVMWEVKIVSGDGYNPMNVYGSVNVSYAYNGDSYVTKLFSRSSDSNVIVYEGGCLPLMRNATGVPLDVDVNVDLDLWDYIHVFPDRCLAKGRLTYRFGGGDQANAKLARRNLVKLLGSGGRNRDCCNTSIEVTAWYSYVSQTYN